MKKMLLTLGCCAALVGCGGAGDDGVTGESVSAEPTVAPDPGRLIYNRFCFSCHGPGTAGAPRVGDSAAWEPRLAKGRDALLEATMEGIPPAMPPMGLCQHCTDEELWAAIEHMLPSASKSGKTSGD